jgi:hypothetical protein
LQINLEVQDDGGIELEASYVDMSCDMGDGDVDNSMHSGEQDHSIGQASESIFYDHVDAEVATDDEDESVHAMFVDPPTMPEMDDKINVEDIEEYTNDEVAELLLLRILQKIGAPKYTYTMMREWAKYLVQNHVDVEHMHNRRASIKYFMGKFQMDKMKPLTVKATVQILDKDQVLKSKQKGFKRYK